MTFSAPLGKNFHKEKRAKKKGAGQNLIFYSRVNAVGENAAGVVKLVQEPVLKIGTAPFKKRESLQVLP